ncbi:MAG: putative NOP5 family protein [Methanonatronarchaeales archaeon]|nr:putative NOP5 family protein [Methanonatronarchaeales archaeon]
MRTWFGTRHGPTDPSIEEVRELASGLRSLAEDEGIPRDEYVTRLHGMAFEDAERAVEEAETSLETRLVRRLRMADELREGRDRLDEYLEEEDDEGVREVRQLMADRNRDLMEEVELLAERLAPNLSALATPALAARLMDLGGGLDGLARKPASTVQLLGAESALFRHLQGGGDPPKHGVLYSHPDVRGAGDRAGEVARALAAKLVIAARIDAYSGRDETDRLVDEWRSRVEEAR